MDPRVEKIMAAADYIAAKLDGRKPFAGIVLGSGLGKLADKIENQIVIPYREIPGFPYVRLLWTQENRGSPYME